MAITQNNAVPMMHFFRAKDNKQKFIALAYITMCSFLLAVLCSDLYIIFNIQENIPSWITTCRNISIFILSAFVLSHISYVFYHNIVLKTNTLAKLLKAKDE